MANLVLQPTIKDFSREDFEARLEAVRARRMVVAVEFYEGKNAKLEHLTGVLRHKAEKQQLGLEKDLEQLDKILERAEGRIERITQYLQEHDLAQAAMVQIGE